MSHTATPWVLIPQFDGNYIVAREYETSNKAQPIKRKRIARIITGIDSVSEDDENAEFIVRACNEYESTKQAMHIFESKTKRLEAVNNSLTASLKAILNFANRYDYQDIANEARLALAENEV